VVGGPPALFFATSASFFFFLLWLRLDRAGFFNAVFGPPLMTQVFGYFSSPAAPVHVPGAAFITAAFLTAACAVVFAKSLNLAALDPLR